MQSGSGGGATVAIVVIVVLVAMLLACGGVAALIGFARMQNVPNFPQPMADFGRLECSDNLKQIALALHNYHDRYKSFPPAVFTDKAGRPMHSWRVAILPFLQRPEAQQIYQRYRWNEPWNSPHNRGLALEFAGYACDDDHSPPGDASYVMITGPNTVGGKPNEAVRIADIVDGTSNTIMVAEVSGSGIGWTEPRDLSIESMPLEVDGPQGKCISSNHDGGAHAALADGSVVLLPSETDAETLRRMILRNDGQQVRVPR